MRIGSFLVAVVLAQLGGCAGLEVAAEPSLAEPAPPVSMTLGPDEVACEDVVEVSLTRRDGASDLAELWLSAGLAPEPGQPVHVTLGEGAGERTLFAGVVIEATEALDHEGSPLRLAIAESDASGTKGDWDAMRVEVAGVRC